MFESDEDKGRGRVRLARDSSRWTFLTLKRASCRRAVKDGHDGAWPSRRRGRRPLSVLEGRALRASAKRFGEVGSRPQGQIALKQKTLAPSRTQQQTNTRFPRHLCLLCSISALPKHILGCE